MKSSKAVLLALLCLTAVPLFAQVNDTYVIPAAINSPGAFGTRWMTQFSVFNPQLDRDLKITVVFVPNLGRQGTTGTFTVPANSVAYSDNILDDLFGIQNDLGALLVATFTDDNPGTDVLSRSFLVTSNTYNNSRNGTYGQTVPGVWTGLQDFATDGISGVVHGIRNISREGWRTNFGAVNLGRCNATLRVSIYDVDGKTLMSKAPYELPPLGHVQDPLPISVDRGSIEFWVDDPCASNPDNAAVVFAYTSTVDQLSGDPAYQTPVLLADPKIIFSKAQTGVSVPQVIGKKLENERARQIRDAALMIVPGRLIRDAGGYRITH
ncbi:MAG TPA: hypothetical protein VLV78_01095 [Thermoanaerobaculia bacterium]|nr:hypothetical protein [Thermoanaerobaculia bacterium]